MNCISEVFNDEVLDEIVNRYHWLNFLSFKNVSVAKPVMLISDDYVNEIRVNGSCFFIVCFEKVNGVFMRELCWSDEYIQKLGREIGKMHHASKNYKCTKREFERPKWNADIFMNQYHDLPELLELRGRFIELMKKIDNLPRNQKNYGLTHGDIHFGNFKFENDVPVFFDFDSCCYCWYLYDIAVLLFFSVCIWGRGQEVGGFSSHFMHHFLLGYEEYTAFDYEMMKYLPLFLKLREYDLFFVLSDLPESEQYEYEKHFMMNRKQNLENDIV